MNITQTARPDIQKDEPEKGVEVGMAIGKLFESQLLGDLSSKEKLEAFQKVLSETLERYGINQEAMKKAISKITFSDGEMKGKRKWKSMEDFFSRTFGKIQKGNDEEVSAAYYDFHDFLRALRQDNNQVPDLLERSVHGNMSLEIAKNAQPILPNTVFTKSILLSLRNKLPSIKCLVINGLGTPMDYLQKIDFVVAILDDKGEIARYYSYDITTDPEKQSSKMKDVVIIEPDDLDAMLDRRVTSCIDKVVQNVVERESSYRERHTHA